MNIIRLILCNHESRVETFRKVEHFVALFDQLRWFGTIEVILAVLTSQTIGKNMSGKIKITLPLSSLRNLLNRPV